MASPNLTRRSVDCTKSSLIVSLAIGPVANQYLDIFRSQGRKILRA